jgi:hypothetical protein
MARVLKYTSLGVFFRTFDAIHVEMSSSFKGGFENMP